MKRIFVLLLVLTVAGISQAAPVVFNDPNLKAAVEAKLGITDPNSDEMLLLISLDANSLGISDLTGLETATNLKYLRLNMNLISALPALSGLTKLTYLNLNDNNIADINSLENLTKLKYLYLSRNDDISDINAISDMNSLSELGLTDVNLTTITPLADVNQIKYLWLGYNNITDINALTKDVNFIELSLSYNPLSFQSWCVYLKQIINNKPSANIHINSFLNDRFTDMKDMQIFASKWLRQNCSLANGDCGGADFGEDGVVDFYDFAIFAEWWMYNK